MKHVSKLLIGTSLTVLALNCYAEATTAGNPETIDTTRNAPPSQGLKIGDVGTLTGTGALTSNYIFRGISQSNNLPAAQTGLTFTFDPIGIYGTLWGSNVDLDSINEDTTATVEIDTIAGIRNTIGENFEYDLNYARYNYPKSDLSYNELNAIVGYHFLVGTLGYSTNVFNAHAPGTYISGGVNFEIPSSYVYFDNVEVSGSVGRYNLPYAAGESYTDYSLGVNKTINIYNLALQWTSTNRQNTNTSVDAGHVIATVTANF